ncbi:MAG TPA: MBL fold metallo-hydrolase [Acidimicrobiales bacterium]|jgi:cyclase|nr:MBL fold metallo-hydrolase [Acidimicrobiales bacterium]
MLDLLVPGVYAWLQTPAAPGRANAGAVVDADGVTVIDTLLSAPQWTPLAAAVDELGLPVPRVVLTGSNAEYAGGTARFRTAAIFGRPQTSAHLDQPADPAILRRMYPELANEIDDEFATRPVSHVVDAAVQLTPALTVIPMRGQQEENLVVVVPAADIVFAGAMCSFGVTPIAHQGDPAAWAESLDQLLDLAPIVVPGHGPIGGEEDVRELQEYLRACVAANGDPSRIGSGPWDGWTGREHDVINVERAAMLARGDDGIPPSLLERLGL